VRRLGVALGLAAALGACTSVGGTPSAAPEAPVPVMPAPQVALRSDVLFAFDDGVVDGNARTALADVIAETRRRADPQRPPIVVVGHTDGIGDDAYNQGLSERRAVAVRDVLAAELGPEYRIEAAGRGSTEPVTREGGADDAEARVRNRRVEIAYRFRRETPPSTTTTQETETERVRAADPGEPAAFRTAYTEAVASRRTATQDAGALSAAAEWTLNVYPFYRDGAYLVASFDLVHAARRHRPDLPRRQLRGLRRRPDPVTRSRNGGVEA
jgi:outer membrane protein OmpA-like peptidoglycan-associated protein